MRELKFRAWDIDKQEYITRFDISSEGCVWTQEINCDPEYPNVILEQYTGLKDKNGIEIYEGDIVSDVHGDYKGEIIRHHSGEYLIKLINIPNATDSLYNTHTLVEIIGNIHENPELLEVE